MDRIYIAIGPEKAVVAVCRDASDINLDVMAKTTGKPVGLYEVGFANLKTPPGPLLIGDSCNVNRRRPIGEKIETD